MARVRDRAVTVEVTMSIREWRLLLSAAYDIGTGQSYHYSKAEQKACLEAYKKLEAAVRLLVK